MQTVEMWLTLEESCVVDDEELELGAGSLQACLHVLTSSHLVALFHPLGAAAWASGLAHLQVRTWPPGGERHGQSEAGQSIKGII